MIHTNFLDDGDDEDDDDQDHDVDDNEEYVEADDTIEEQVEKLEVSLEGACSVADEELGMFDDQDGNGDDNGDDKSNKGLEISNASSIAISHGYQLSTVNSPDIQNTPTNDSPVNTPEYNEKVAKEDDISSSECHQPKQITTKLCKNIARILGETSDVLLLDRARKDMQFHPKSTFHQDKYKNLLTQMQTRILAEHASLKEEHNNWEKEF